jgi:hypothetical protein
LTPAIRPCSLLSKREELIGISAVWNGFFITASASFDRQRLQRRHPEGREVEDQEPHRPLRVTDVVASTEGLESLIRLR